MVATSAKQHPRLEKVVERAIVVSRQIRALTTELDGLKARLRGEAFAIADGATEKIELASAAGTATVTFPKARVAIRDGAIPETLKAILPEPTWSKIFAVKISPADDAEAIWLGMTGAARKALDRVLEHRESTPAVLLPK